MPAVCGLGLHEGRVAFYNDGYGGFALYWKADGTHEVGKSVFPI